MFINRRFIKRGLTAGIAIVAAGFPTVAHAMYVEDPPAGNSVSTTVSSSLPTNFHTDASSGYVSEQASSLPTNFHTDASSGYVSEQASSLPSNFHTDASSGYVSEQASSLPSNFHTDASSGGYVPEQAGPQFASVAQTGSGFQWGDAGIGAAGAIVLMGAAAGASVSIRRRRVRGILVG